MATPLQTTCPTLPHHLHVIRRLKITDTERALLTPRVAVTPDTQPLPHSQTLITRSIATLQLRELARSIMVAHHHNHTEDNMARRLLRDMVALAIISRRPGAPIQANMIDIRDNGFSFNLISLANFNILFIRYKGARGGSCKIGCWLDWASQEGVLVWLISWYQA